MKALITAGGHGTRLRPITHTQNKHLIPIANKPILNYALEYVKEAGITDVGIITNKDGTEVKNVYGDGSDLGLKITYIPQDAPNGLADCIRIAQPFLNNEPFVFYLGDNIIVGGIKRFIDEFKANKSNCHLVLSKVPDPERFGVPEIDGNKIITIEEKPQNPKSEYAVTGIYIYDENIFEAVNSIVPSARGELEISDANQYLLDKKLNVTFSEITGWWKDTGKPADLLEANRLVLDNIKKDIKGSVCPHTKISGRVIVEEGAEIKNSNIRGSVMISKGTKISDSYIGPYTAIDTNCHIEKSELEFSIISSGCKIKDQDVRIEDSIFGENVSMEKVESRPRVNRFIIGENSNIRNC